MRHQQLKVALGSLALIACSGSSGAESQAGAASPKPPFTVHAVAKFDTPWAMAFLTGSGRPLLDAALVTEKEGRLWLVDSKNGRRWPVSGVPAVKVAGQGGLGDVAVHPEFVVNRRVYLSFVEAGPGGTSGAALGYGMLDLANRERPALRDFRVIWRQQPKVDGNGHFSHRIAFGRDGFLYLSSGDRQKMTPAQDRRNDLGKILRLTPEGLPAPGNPFNRAGVDSTINRAIWSYGHRNALGLAFAPDGRLWASEMGPQGGDELNLIVAGRNYGWPKVSNGSHYGGVDIPDHKPRDGYEPPKLWWGATIAPGGLLIYNGNKFPGWKGDALIPALAGQALVRVDINGDRARKAGHWPMGERIRAVDEGPDGSVYLLEDGGRLLRLDPVSR